MHYSLNSGKDCNLKKEKKKKDGARIFSLSLFSKQFNRIAINTDFLEVVSPQTIVIYFWTFKMIVENEILKKLRMFLSFYRVDCKRTEN